MTKEMIRLLNQLADFVYVNTEISTYVLRYMYRYADNLKDYTGYHNRFANTLIELSSNIAKLLEVPVNQTRDVRI